MYTDRSILKSFLSAIARGWSHYSYHDVDDNYYFYADAKVHLFIFFYLLALTVIPCSPQDNCCFEEMNASSNSGLPSNSNLNFRVRLSLPAERTTE
jgi:hypothetical protein